MSQSSLDFEQVIKDIHDEGASSIQVVPGPAGSNSLNTVVKNALVPVPYDYIGATYPVPTTEVYTYKTGGASGTVVATVTVVYTSSTKDILLSVTRT
jgi:hypothetical protein